MLFGCLREKNIEDFFIVFELIYSLLDFGYEYFVVMVDGEFLIDELVKLFEQGFVSKVLVLFGVNKNDGGIVFFFEIVSIFGQEVFFEFFSSLVKIVRFLINEELDFMKEVILYQYINYLVLDFF